LQGVVSKAGKREQAKVKHPLKTKKGQGPLKNFPFKKIELIPQIKMGDDYQRQNEQHALEST